MIAAVANSATSIADKLSISWFDAVFVAVLGFGLFRGRRNGMSKELLPLMQWITVVVLCGLVYPIVGQIFINSLSWRKSTADITGYIALALVVFIIFSVIKRLFAEKLVKSDVFKGGEYYFGMPVGMVRFACMLLVALAFLNAPFYTQQEIANQKATAKANFGGGTMSGDFFPSLNDVQQQVFVQSAVGRFIKQTFGVLLINTAQPNATKPKPAAVLP
jgi:uncharacterized membrane protein required for colicin V production